MPLEGDPLIVVVSFIVFGAFALLLAIAILPFNVSREGYNDYPQSSCWFVISVVSFLIAAFVAIGGTAGDT